MLTEMVEYGCKIEEDGKSMQSEIKENLQGTNSKGKETRTKINSLDQNKQINIQPEQNEKTRIQKKKKKNPMRRGLGTSGMALNIPKSES